MADQLEHSTFTVIRNDKRYTIRFEPVKTKSKSKWRVSVKSEQDDRVLVKFVEPYFHANFTNALKALDRVVKQQPKRKKNILKFKLVR